MPYYINAPTLSAATAIYSNPEMTICAPDGYYADGPVVRQQVGCILLPARECPFCGAACGCSFSGPVNEGVYYFSVDLGSATGPVQIIFDPLDFPNGIEAVYDSTYYNTVVSPFFGPLTGVAGFPTFIGLDTEDCGIVGTHTLPEFEYRTADTSFHNLGTTDVINVTASQLQLTWAAPGTCTMIIPKPNASPTNLLVRVITTCPKDSFDISILCPGDVTVYPITASGEGGPGDLICGYPADYSTYYVIPVNGDGTTFGLYDFVYQDAACSIPAVDNYYLSAFCPSPYKWFRIENGIIVEFGDCDATYNYDVLQCGNPALGTFTVLSPFLLTLGNLVSLAGPSYTGCKFQVISTTEGTPVAVVTAQYTETCSDVCAYYKVYNYQSTPQLASYADCAGAPQSITIPVHSFAYICARVGSISGKVEPVFHSCQCE